MSNGGEMSYLLACNASDVFCSVAPVAGTMMNWFYDACEPLEPISIFEIHGTDDNIPIGMGIAIILEVGGHI